MSPIKPYIHLSSVFCNSSKIFAAFDSWFQAIDRFNWDKCLKKTSYTVLNFIYDEIVAYLLTIGRKSCYFRFLLGVHLSFISRKADTDKDNCIPRLQRSRVST